MAGELERFGETVEDWRDPVSGPVAFGASFVKSPAFKALFSQGMALVEETASYLDGDGRTESNRLGRSAALTYAAESMRLTTRLMQIASWLLVQRAVAEGEISQAQAQREKDRVRLVAQDGSGRDAHAAELPERLRDLIDGSLRMHGRIMHLDGLISGSGTSGARGLGTAVAQQQRLLRSVFEVGAA